MALPSVLTEDLISPQGVQAAGLVAGNLQQIADRSAQLAMAKAKLDLESKMRQRELDQQAKLADAELKAKADQYTQYQDFQAKESEKQRNFEAQREQARLDAEQKRQSEIFKRQDEAVRQDNIWKSKELELRAAKARAASDAANASDAEINKITEQRQLNNKKIAALEFENMVASEKQGEFVKFATEEGASIDAQRMQIGRAILTETADAISSSITDAVSGERHGLAGVAAGAARQQASGNVMGNPAATEVASRAVSGLANWLGLEYFDPAHATSMTDAGMLVNNVVTKLSPKLAGIAAGGTPADVDAALKNFMASGLKAQQALASDGAIKGADEEAVLSEFTKHSERLQELIGAEGLQGLVKGLEQAGGLFSGTEQTNLTKGEVAARKTAMTSVGRISDAFNLAKMREGTTLSSGDYEQPVSKMFADILNGYAKTSFNAPDFAQQLKRIGVKPSQVNGLIAKLQEMKFTPPEDLARRMKELQEQNDELDTLSEIAVRRTTNKAVKAGADIELQGVEDLRKSLGLD